MPAEAFPRNDWGVLIFPESTTGVGTTKGEEVETACGTEVAEPPADDFGLANLSYHNAARAAHGAMPMVWDAELAAEAQEWAEFLQSEMRLMHSTTAQRGPTGENLYFASSSDGSSEAAIANTDVASRAWYEQEEGLYGYDGQFSSGTGHFTQMVWKDSCKLGCGYTENFVVCRYSPQGNFLGQFDTKVMPPMV